MAKKIVVEVCTGTHCVLMGSMHMMDSIASLAEIREEMGSTTEIEVKAVPCLNLCKSGTRGPFVIVDGKTIPQAEADVVMAEIMSHCNDECSNCDC
ncbi:MAG: (2Fe-2S) ferredoxin domain-containing protein [Christensenellaceae bacterium]|nr:(2Fe-2S) ferredoxin domain-containing protein [Christensenellaceae bacterium]